MKKGPTYVQVRLFLFNAPLTHRNSASDKVAGIPRPASMDCGGKRSATPLWVEVTQGVEPGALYWQGKRRRASLAAAVQSDFVTGAAHRYGASKARFFSEADG